MFKIIISGILIGIANIIPGVSGGNLGGAHQSVRTNHGYLQ